MLCTCSPQQWTLTPPKTTTASFWVLLQDFKQETVAAFLKSLVKCCREVLGISFFGWRWFSLCESLFVGVMMALSPLRLCVRLTLLEWERGEICAADANTKWLFHSFRQFDLEPRATRSHPLDNHSTPTSRRKLDAQRATSPPSLGIVRHKPVKSVFGFVWACWIRVGLGLWSTKLYVRTLMGKFTASSRLRVAG